ncbi:3-methyladenine DNA glycosylase [Mycobacterium sp. NPDC048908]|uniref:3-methyladenine DNA glycosylase n=1 Tax=Mycobacterium sp. NPDC048908 TaxID=3364292 RepID=UPI003721D907
MPDVGRCPTVPDVGRCPTVPDVGHRPTVPDVVLTEPDWTARERRHQARVDEFCEPHRHRARVGEAHPVWDFLWTYYSLRPRQLRIWHPGFGATLTGAAAERHLSRAGYGRSPRGVAVTSDHLRARADTVRFIALLLHATASRPGRLNCFGMHEWAMVYRAPAVRHAHVPLRLGQAGTDTVVESMPLRCSHFDAYRFFTEPAVGRNVERLTRDGQVAAEQPACVHANMDLYKWAFKLGPLVPSELVMDCLELAARARSLDMRASPYDLRDYGFDAIPVETPAGRAEYVRAQQSIAEQAAPLRATLASWCDLLLTAAAGE